MKDGGVYEVVGRYINKVIRYLVSHNTLTTNLLSPNEGRFSLFIKKVRLLVRA